MTSITFVFISLLVKYSHAGLLDQLEDSSLTDPLLVDDMTKFLTALDNMDFKKIGSDFTQDMEDQLRYNLGLENEDKCLDGYQLLVKYGLTYKKYIVKTEDGYELTLVHVPGCEGGPPVLLVHAYFFSFQDFITSGPDKALVYLLHSKGYDVWLLNVRGTTFSLNHTTLSPKEKSFWDFSFHEVGMYDVQATIDFILSKSCHKQVIYLGHSHGNTPAFVLLSERTEYNEKIKLLVCLSPVTYMGHANSPALLALTPLRDQEYFLLHLLGQYTLLSDGGLISLVRKSACFSSVSAGFVCSNIPNILYGVDPFQLNFTNVPVEYAHVPQGISLKMAIHAFQLVASGKFEQFDYGKKKNLEKYCSSSPPDYDLTKVTAPVAIFYAQNDGFSNVKDVKKLIKKLPNVVEKYLVPFKFWTLTDFLWGKDVVDLLYKRMFEVMEKYVN